MSRQKGFYEEHEDDEADIKENTSFESENEESDVLEEDDYAPSFFNSNAESNYKLMMETLLDDPELLLDNQIDFTDEDAIHAQASKFDEEI